MEVGDPLRSAILEVEGLRAFEQDFAVVGAAGGPDRFRFSVGPVLAMLGEVADRFGIRGCGFIIRENPGFVQLDLVVHRVL
jgi:hypothetical protein